MRILWFSNIPMPGMLGYGEQEHAASGGWMISLLEKLIANPKIEIAVACTSPGLSEGMTTYTKNCWFYTTSQGPKRRLLDFRSLDNDPRYLKKCVKVVEDYKPDIIHIHGSERFYGLLGARELVVPPVIISLQGLLHEYALYRNYFGVTPLRDILSLHDPLHLIRGMGPLPDYLHAKRSAKREIEILSKNHWFMGRTIWDYSHLKSLNPEAHYFHVPEMLRSSFYTGPWDIHECKCFRILFTNANSFNRGIEILLDAVAILKKEFPSVCLALAGGVESLPYGKVIQRRIGALDLQEDVEFLGPLTGDQMVLELKKTHIFVISSFLENSPNSLCEAQLVGLPCVVSYVGGIPSLVEESRTGLFFPPGDAPMLAERIRQIFVNDHLACSLGAQARRTALVRHDPNTIVNQVIETYETVINNG